MKALPVVDDLGNNPHIESKSRGKVRNDILDGYGVLIYYQAGLLSVVRIKDRSCWSGSIIIAPGPRSKLESLPR